MLTSLKTVNGKINVFSKFFIYYFGNASLLMKIEFLANVEIKSDFNVFFNSFLSGTLY